MAINEKELNEVSGGYGPSSVSLCSRSASGTTSRTPT